MRKSVVSISWHMLAFVGAFMILAGLAWQARDLQRSMLEANGSVLHTLELSTAGQTLFSSLQDVESGERGYIITGKDTYLEPYKKALARIPADHMHLTQLLSVAGLPRSGWLEELNIAIARRLAISAGNIAARRQLGLEAATERVLNAGGKQTMDVLRSLFNELEASELRLQLTQNQALQRQIDNNRRFALLGSIFVVLLFLSAFWAVSRSNRARLQLVREAEAQAARLDALLKAVPDTLFEINARQKVRHLSLHETAQVTDDIAAIDTVLTKHLPANGTQATRQFHWSDPDGNTFEVRIVPAGPENHLAIVRDVSESLRNEKMKSEFVSTVSHELRTPLTAIRGALSMLQSGMVGDIPADSKPLLNIAHKNCERLVNLINDILDIEKLESGRLLLNLVAIPVAPLLRQSLEFNAPYAQEFDVELELCEPVPDATARIDPDRFAQVMANLLSNAIKHSPTGGAVTVSCNTLANELEISVIDRGKGVPEAFRSRIFQRFAQADSSDVRRRGGTGLGLAITQSLVEQMSGQVGFESTPGQGARFFVRLPLVSASVPPATPAQASRVDAPSQRILVIEPNSVAAAELADILQAQGYEPVISHDTAAARKQLRNGSFNAVTLSPGLQDESCIAFLQSLREQAAYRHLPIIVVSLQATGPDSLQTELRGSAVGVMDWLQKPIDASRVLEVVRACMQTTGRRPSILHVEDDSDLRVLIKTLLSPLSVDLYGAGSIAEAREQLAQRHHDLAILDLMLPDGDGSELIEELALAAPPTQVVIFSAKDAPLEQSRLVLQQLVKSRHDSEELAATIRQIVQRWSQIHRPKEDI